MSRIDELIAEFAPSGVRYEPLGDIGEWYGGGTPSKERLEYWQNGTIPWVSPKDMGRTIVDSTEDYITEAAVKSSATKIVPANSVAVVVRSSILDRILPTALIPVPVTLNQDMKAVVARNGILPGYIAHLLRSNGPAILRTARKTGGSVASIESRKLFSFRIPVPPLEVQHEIVKVLDAFTELEAELEVRRQQYQYYRDALLTFDENGMNASKQASVRWMALNDICLNASSGGTPLSTRNEYYGGGIPWLRTQEVDYADIHATTVTITEDGLRNSSAKWVPVNSIIVAISGAGVTRGRVAVNKIPLTTNQHCCNMEIDAARAHYRYVYHWLVNQYDDLRSRGQGNRSDLNAGIIKAYPIPVPPLEEQARIASILDKFDVLVNDLSSGLPAELAARRKQYEHYRDRLLTFEEEAS